MSAFPKLGFRCFLSVAALVAASCQVFSTETVVYEEAPMSLEQSVFGTTADGEEVTEYLLKNDVGMTARVITLGATLRTLTVPDARGNVTDVVLGFDDVAGYESTDNQYFGCTVGRVANRIAEGRFALEGRPYRLATNNGPNHLHGGDRGWDKAVWAAHGKLTEEGPAVMLTHTSPSYDEGYPGQVTASVTYTLTHAGELRLEYEARASDATPINMTHHSYFNLAGAGAETVLDHELLVLADRYTPVDDDLIPTGALADVRETPLDFRRSTRIGDRVEELVPTATIGYDHNYALADGPRRLSQACTLRDPASGRVMEIWTTEPGLQFYTGNFLFGQTGKGGATYALRSACCLETQHFPDSVNQPTFPSTIYAPGRTYTQTTVHRFYAE